MKIQLQAVLIFDEADMAEANKLFEAINRIKDKLQVIKPVATKTADERSFAELRRYYHDEDPVKPCEPIERLDALG